MNILFVHRDFPGQFKYLVKSLASNPKNNVFFITNDDKNQISGVKKLVYQVPKNIPADTHPFLSTHEELLLHGQAAASLTLGLRKQKIKFDVIYVHPSGPGLFMKYIYPDIPMVYYCEWFSRAQGSDIDFEGNSVDEVQKMQIRASNSINLIDLYSSDACVTSTNWQKQQFPKEFHNKIQVIYNGVDTEKFKPSNDAKFLVKEKNIEFGLEDEVITYGTRGMEPYRGFPQFLEIAVHLQKKRPNLHVIITGEDKTYYSPQLVNDTFKNYMLKNLSGLDTNRVHFVRKLPHDNYAKLLQVSSAHVYFTYPYILSQSVLEAMSAGCCIVASDTKPVLEFVKDGENGLLFGFNNFNQIVEKIEYALDNKEKMQKIRAAARKTIIENYSLDKVLPQQINLINNLINRGT